MDAASAISNGENVNEHVIELNDANWDAEVLKAGEPVLVDFWAEWCPPCRALSPIIDELASDFAGRLKVGKVNVDQSPGVAGRYGVRSIPTLLLFSGGEVADQRVGARPKAELQQLLESQLQDPEAVAP